MKNITPLEKNLGIKFKNKNLLHTALIHRSYLNENPRFPLPHNERLEFLGDAVLELIVTKFLYKNFANPEGELTTYRASLVNTRTLSRIASKLKIKQFLYLSKGEKKSSGKAKEVILANTFEAIVGAIYLDQGFLPAEQFIKRVLLPELDFILAHELFKDAKSKFQEIAQAKFKITPEYKVIKEWGPDHAKKFTVGLFIEEKLITVGTGKSKQEAETQAARNALKKGIA